MDKEELRREIQGYNSDEDIENSGGRYGMVLANLMYLYDLTESNDEGLPSNDERSQNKGLQSKISRIEFINLANEMGIPNASRIGAIDSKISLLEYAGISHIEGSNGEIIEISEGTPQEIDSTFRRCYR